MSANIANTQKPVARPATAERLRLECNGGVVLAEAVVDVLAKAIVIVLAEDVGEGTLVTWDGLNVEGVMAKVLELEDVSMFGLIIKPRLLSLLLIKPGGLPVDVSFPVGSSSCNPNLGLADIILRSTPSSTPRIQE